MLHLFTPRALFADYHTVTLHRTGYLWLIRPERTLTTYLQHQSRQPISRQCTFLCSVIVTHCHCVVLELSEQNFPPDWWFFYFFFPPPPLIPSLQSSIFCNLSSRLMVRILHKLITIRCAKMHLYVHLSFGFLLEACFVFCFFLLLAFKLFSIQHEKN